MGPRVFEDFMKKLVVIIVLLVIGFVKLKTALSNGQALDYFDSKPHQKGTATSLYLMANFYELTSNYPLAEKSFRMIVDKYPNYRYAMECYYGWAHAVEMQKDRRRAIAAYEEFLKAYPSGPRSQTVRNNIDILR
jgi:TolA-binding protein